ncbi:MAG: UDP-4-amino-4,6-dideoxy-N-acetyl-beta-L-altrosamine transaminase [Acidobacteria bacterium]|nr:UDP-4-amino-4,6-dideoxy-N-acetyl-beta-L-altrosamine transaminase [Acidobacteriota bacterium]MCA1650879.1 UDP-4-amino-4,6-dideoxy-N-acetyl-beta-L-altrosamine transaminase [Acidobacteriota bacterium]
MKAEAMKTLAYGRHWIDERDRAAVDAVLSGDWLTQGPTIGRFEHALQEVTGATHAVACSNGTAALHVTAAALGWGPGDHIVMPAITFLASANCCRYVGAHAVFADIQPETFTLNPAQVERQVQALRASGARVRGIIGVDLTGHPCDWPALRDIADRYSLDLVDDAAHALGARGPDGITIGSGVFADVTTLSFHPVKAITTGEGGAILTNREDLADRARRLCSHGTVRGETQVPDWEGPWHVDMVELGFNYRLTDMQAALGITQLTRLDTFIDQRHALAERYDRAFADDPLVRVQHPVPGIRHAHHLYVIRVPFDNGAVSRRELFERCRKQGILLQVHYRPVMLNSYYARSDGKASHPEALPESLRYYAECVTLPLFPQMTEADVDRVVATVRECLR